MNLIIHSGQVLSFKVTLASVASQIGDKSTLNYFLNQPWFFFLIISGSRNILLITIKEQQLTLFDAHCCCKLKGDRAQLRVFLRCFNKFLTSLIPGFSHRFREKSTEVISCIRLGIEKASTSKVSADACPAAALYSDLPNKRTSLFINFTQKINPVHSY